jgi:hypothetical protein
LRAFFLSLRGHIAWRGCTSRGGALEDKGRTSTKVRRAHNLLLRRGAREVHPRQREEGIYFGCFHKQARARQRQRAKQVEGVHQGKGCILQRLAGTKKERELQSKLERSLLLYQVPLFHFLL